MITAIKNYDHNNKFDLNDQNDQSDQNKENDQDKQNDCNDQEDQNDQKYLKDLYDQNIIKKIKYAIFTSVQFFKFLVSFFTNGCAIDIVKNDKS